jgi:hypothetical protein
MFSKIWESIFYRLKNSLETRKNADFKITQVKLDPKEFR